MGRVDSKQEAACTRPVEISSRKRIFLGPTSISAVVTRFFCPPLTPLNMASPTTVSAQICVSRLEIAARTSHAVAGAAVHQTKHSTALGAHVKAEELEHVVRHDGLPFALDGLSGQQRVREGVGLPASSCLRSSQLCQLLCTDAPTAQLAASFCRRCLE